MLFIAGYENIIVFFHCLALKLSSVVTTTAMVDATCDMCAAAYDFKILQ
jgi:hypothetical protein